MEWNGMESKAELERREGKGGQLILIWLTIQTREEPQLRILDSALSYPHRSLSIFPSTFSPLLVLSSPLLCWYAHQVLSS